MIFENDIKKNIYEENDCQALGRFLESAKRTDNSWSYYSRGTKAGYLIASLTTISILSFLYVIIVSLNSSYYTSLSAELPMTLSILSFIASLIGVITLSALYKTFTIKTVAIRINALEKQKKVISLHIGSTSSC